MTWIMFLVSYIQTVFMAFNGRNIAQGRYHAAFWASNVVGLLWVINVALLAHKITLPIALADIIGGSTGLVTGMYIHKKLLPPKPPSEW